MPDEMHCWQGSLVGGGMAEVAEVAGVVGMWCEEGKMGGSDLGCFYPFFLPPFRRRLAASAWRVSQQNKLNLK